MYLSITCFLIELRHNLLKFTRYSQAFKEYDSVRGVLKFLISIQLIGKKLKVSQNKISTFCAWLVSSYLRQVFSKPKMQMQYWNIKKMEMWYDCNETTYMARVPNEELTTLQKFIPVFCSFILLILWFAIRAVLLYFLQLFRLYHWQFYYLNRFVCLLVSADLSLTTPLCVVDTLRW